MITISIDDKLPIAKETASLMHLIDPEGTHSAEKSPEKVLSTIEESQPDIVWLDIEMPGMNGLEVAAKIKTASPFTNIVFVTGYPEYAYEAMQMHASGFILKPVTEQKLVNEIMNLRRPVSRKKTKVIQVRCFGNFEVFHNGSPIHFARRMSKELFAYLIDRRGAGCSTAELCAVLWEDRPADTGLKSQCRNLIRTLRTSLQSIDAEDVIVKGWSTIGVDCDKIDCDYYDYLRGDPYTINSFRGEYMMQYSWAEMTIGTLRRKPGHIADLF